MFKGNDGHGVQSTTHAEIKHWVKNLIVPQQAARIRRFDYEEMVAEAMASSNEQMK